MRKFAPLMTMYGNLVNHADYSLRQVAVLMAIGTFPGVFRMSETAATLNMSSPAISRAVDVLVNDGLVDRQQNPSDRRGVCLTLTDKGVETSEIIYKAFQQATADRIA